jgi:hypothetical protein
MARTVGEVVSRRPHLTDRLGFITAHLSTDVGPKASYMNLRESISGSCGLEVCVRVTRRQMILDR